MPGGWPWSLGHICGDIGHCALGAIYHGFFLDAVKKNELRSWSFHLSLLFKNIKSGRVKNVFGLLSWKICF